MSRIIIDPERVGPRISRHIYGHFAEHLGRCIYDGVWVGEDSVIPNTRGIRNDIVDALKKIKIPNLRWPGGCFADTYHWKSGIGPRAERPSIVNIHWGGTTEDNSFGTHEFLDLCEQLDCEPYICGNVGSGSVQEMMEWVEYVNSDANSPMTELRAANGREKSWGVTFWGVGNENWGCGGNMRPEYYSDVYRRYACYCKDYGENRLQRIACGPNGDNYHWTEAFLKNVSQAGTGGKVKPSRMTQGFALHYYTRCDGPSNSATEFGEEEWYNMLHNARRMDELIIKHSAIMDQYDPERQIPLVVDEWGTWYAVEPGTNPRFLYQQNSLRDALVAALTFDIFHNHSDRVGMACIAQTVNVLQAMVLTDGASMLLTPTYHVYEMNTVHHDAWSLPIVLESPEFSVGSITLPTLSASASKSDDATVNLSVSNLSAQKDENLAVDIRGSSTQKVQGRILTASTINAHNTFDKNQEVKPVEFDGFTVSDGRLSLTIPAKSVVVLTVSP